MSGPTPVPDSALRVAQDDDMIDPDEAVQELDEPGAAWGDSGVSTS